MELQLFPLGNPLRSGRVLIRPWGSDAVSRVNRFNATNPINAPDPQLKSRFRTITAFPLAVGLHNLAFHTWLNLLYGNADFEKEEKTPVFDLKNVLVLGLGVVYFGETLFRLT